ncbi:MAG: glutamine--tRNA ligase/YqeY domain fusion protein [Clostridiales bacterium]|nr:glutamine--tRNA ligase/YqeY domain fusion protein [Clostridiales bacterium]
MEDTNVSRSFIEEYIKEDYEKYPVVKTRFPPEPNGYLHIGHVKAMWVDFSMAEKFGGSCNLRFDDTNPVKEDVEYVEAIKQDIKWMGFSWDKLCFGSDYFDKCYELAVKLIKKGVAYVCDLDKDQIREYRGTLTEPGIDSPYRNRSVEENLDLFERMKNGEFPDGARTLRAKIDMASPNINMRDPALYRILHRSHHHTGDKWCIYPMYDFAHPIQDAIEGVTHSLCSLEYEAHRPLYNWVIEQCEFEHKPRQIEFARLNITNTVMSKRYLRMMVENGVVSGWDDPRMPTLCAMRRRGYPAAAIRDFLERAGVAKADSTVDYAMLEHCVRENLNLSALRTMAVIDPVKLVIENWDGDKTEDVELENLPVDGVENGGTHSVPFGRELYIERDDFMIDPPKKYFRLKPDGEVRLKGAYIIKCTGWETDENGRVTLIRAEYDPESRSGDCQRKVKGTIHWVPAASAVPAEFRLYEPLFTTTEVDTDRILDFIDPNSVTVMHGFVEPYLNGAKPGAPYQFMRVGYFTADPDSREGAPVFNRTVGLKDSYKPAQ